MANVLQTYKVDAQCDKLAADVRTKLTMLRVESRYRTRISHTPPALGVVSVLPRFSASENWSPCVVCVILLLAVSVERRLVTGGRTDGHTYTRRQLSLIPTPAIVTWVKTLVYPICLLIAQVISWCY